MEGSKFLRIGGRGEDGTAKPIQTDDNGRIITASKSIINKIIDWISGSSYKTILDEDVTIPGGGTWVSDAFDCNNQINFYTRTGTPSPWEYYVLLDNAESDIVEVECEVKIIEESVIGDSGNHFLITPKELIPSGRHKLKVVSTSSSDHSIVAVASKSDPTFLPLKNISSIGDVADEIVNTRERNEIQDFRAFKGGALHEELEPVPENFVGLQAVLALPFHWRTKTDIDLYSVWGTDDYIYTGGASDFKKIDKLSGKVLRSISSGIVSSIRANGNNLFIAESNSIVRRNPITLYEIWSIDTGARTRSVSVSDDGETVYGGNDDGVVTAIDASTGNVIWEYNYPDGGVIASSWYYDGHLYFGIRTPGRRMVKLDINGDVVSDELQESAVQWVQVVGGQIVNYNTVDGDSNFVYNQNGNALDKRNLYDGSIEGATSSFPNTISSVKSDMNGAVFITFVDDGVAKINVSDMSVIWHAKKIQPTERIEGSFIDNNGFLYTASRDQTLAKNYPELQIKGFRAVT